MSQQRQRRQLPQRIQQFGNPHDVINIFDRAMNSVLYRIYLEGAKDIEQCKQASRTLEWTIDNKSGRQLYPNLPNTTKKQSIKYNDGKCLIQLQAFLLNLDKSDKNLITLDEIKLKLEDAVSNLKADIERRLISKNVHIRICGGSREQVCYNIDGTISPCGNSQLKSTTFFTAVAWEHAGLKKCILDLLAKYPGRFTFYPYYIMDTPFTRHTYTPMPNMQYNEFRILSSWKPRILMDVQESTPQDVFQYLIIDDLFFSGKQIREGMSDIAHEIQYQLSRNKQRGKETTTFCVIGMAASSTKKARLNLKTLYTNIESKQISFTMITGDRNTEDPLLKTIDQLRLHEYMKELVQTTNPSMKEKLKTNMLDILKSDKQIRKSIEKYSKTKNKSTLSRLLSFFTKQSEQDRFRSWKKKNKSTSSRLQSFLNFFTKKSEQDRFRYWIDQYIGSDLTPSYMNYKIPDAFSSHVSRRPLQCKYKSQEQCPLPIYKVQVKKVKKQA